MGISIKLPLNKKFPFCLVHPVLDRVINNKYIIKIIVCVHGFYYRVNQ